MNVERIVKEIKAVFEGSISSQEFNYKKDDKIYRVLEINIISGFIDMNQWIGLNEIIEDYSLKIFKIGIAIYSNNLFIYLIEK